MKIIVTGGAGFIGGNFVHYMLREHPEDQIICLDALTYAGNMETLAPVMDNAQFKFIRADIADRETVYRIFAEEKPAVLVNFAAESHVDRSIEQPEIFLRTNIIGTSVLLDACRKYGIQRYHQVSTDEVYGDLPLDRPDLFFTETTNLHTSSPYSASKASADLLVLAYARTYGLPVSITRCSNNYGPYQFPEKLIPLMILNALEGKPLPVYGDGMNVRDWLFVTDHCSAIWRVMTQAEFGTTYNVGGRNELANLRVVEKICDLVDAKAPPLPGGKPRRSLIAFVKDRPGHDRRYAIDCSKIERDLGWRPAETWATGFERTVAWYLSHFEWCAQVRSGDYQKWIAAHYG